MLYYIFPSTQLQFIEITATCFDFNQSSFRRACEPLLVTKYRINTQWDDFKLYPTCTYNRVLADEPSGPEHIQDIVKIKTLV